MVVDRGNLADSLTIGKLVRVLIGAASPAVDGDNPQAVDVILLEVGLHDADERLAIWSDRETFHALVRDAAKD